MTIYNNNPPPVGSNPAAILIDTEQEQQFNTNTTATTTTTTNDEQLQQQEQQAPVEEPPCPWEESLELTRKQRKLQQQQQQQTSTEEKSEEKTESEEKAPEQEEENVIIVKTNNNNNNKNTTATNSVFRHYMRCYYELWKTRLSSLVVFTTLGGYYASGGAIGDWRTILALTGGTFMQAACANSLNQLMEVERDRMMTRTTNRPLPTNRISKFHTLLQSVIMGVGGSYLLYKYNNPLTSALGVANIVIYAGMYTPCKVMHWINTWIGTLNGSLAPLMGSACVTNRVMDPAGLFLFGTMYLWQISHFMAIGYKCKFDYNRAGYQMLSISNPEQSATQAVVHAAALFPLCYALPYYGVLPWWFAIVSTPINYYLMLKPSIQFKRAVNYETATSLFFRTLGHLPALFFTSVFAFCWQRGLKSWLREQVVDRLVDVGRSLMLSIGSAVTSATSTTSE